MNKKMKECFTPHAIMHNFLGLGLGLLAAVYFPALVNVTLAVAIIVVAVAADMMRK